MDEYQERFLKDEFFSLTLMATVQRADVYVRGLSLHARGAFQTALRTRLEQLAAFYHAAVSEEDHIQNIVALSEGLSTDYADILTGRRFRIGTAQKALNLYLKYLWCVGKIPPPPHCPFDFRVITKLPGCRGISWTALDSVTQYRQLVAAAKIRAQGVSLPKWELQTYNNAQLHVAPDPVREASQLTR